MVNAPLKKIATKPVTQRESRFSLEVAAHYGRFLLEDAAGVSGTLLVKAMTLSISARFKKIQFTPDGLLPSDITGTPLSNQQTHKRVYQQLNHCYTKVIRYSLRSHLPGARSVQT